MKQWRTLAAKVNAAWKEKHGEQPPPGLSRRLAKLASAKVPAPLSPLMWALLIRGGWAVRLSSTKPALPVASDLESKAIYSHIEGNEHAPVL